MDAQEGEISAWYFSEALMALHIDPCLFDDTLEFGESPKGDVGRLVQRDVHHHP